MRPGKGQYKGKAWANHAVSAKGCRIWYNLPGEGGDRAGHGLISFPGSALANLPAAKVRRLVLCLKRQFGIKVTRVDIAIDDYSKKIGFSQVRDAINAGNKANFGKGKITENFGEERGGFTIVCGSPKSNRQLIFYDKNAESEGQINAYRWEARLKDEIADKAIDEWLEVPEKLSAHYLAAVVSGIVAFVERGKEKNISRMKELPWWKEFKDAIGASIRHSVQRVRTNLKKAKKWINRQVACMLAAIKEVVGEESFTNWISNQIDEAPERFNQNHYARIIQWKHEYSDLGNGNSAMQ
jgi:DNA relaxase NicK